MNFLRLILVFLIVYLIVRAFVIAGSTKGDVEKKPAQNDRMGHSKGVPKSIGEYVDYEEIDKSV